MNLRTKRHMKPIERRTMGTPPGSKAKIQDSISGCVLQRFCDMSYLHIPDLSLLIHHPRMSVSTLKMKCSIKTHNASLC